MSSRVETFTPANTPNPIGPYNHIAKVGQFISIGGTAGVDPATGELAGPNVGCACQVAKCGRLNRYDTAGLPSGRH